MAEILINKKSKRINVKLAFLDNNGKSRLNILTEGPLGKISCDISNFATLSGNKFFIKKDDFQPIIKIPVEIYIPENFINDVDLRLSIYKRISNPFYD